MNKSAGHRAVERHRRRLAERGMARFEVRGLEADRELIRKFADALSRDDDRAKRLRDEVRAKVSEDADRKGGILAALLASPLVGSGIDLEREPHFGRDVDL